MVQRLTSSPTHLSLATFCLILPSVLFSTMAGLLVDHFNKRTVLVATNFLRVMASLSYLFLDRTLFLVYIVTFLFSTVGQFFAPAEASTIPLLVGREQLITANGLFNLTLSATQLVGLVILAPLLIKLVGISGFLIALAVLFSLATIFVWFLPRDNLGPTARLTTQEGERLVRSMWNELREGWHILRSDTRTSLAMFYLTLMASLIPLLAVLGPVFAVSVIRASAEDVVYLFAPAGISMVLTTTVLGKLVARLGKVRLMSINLAAMGVTLVLVGMAKTGGSYLLYNMLGRVINTRHVVFELIPIIAILSFALGIEFVCISVPAQTMLQERCPASFRGRIFGVQFTLSGAASLLPLLGAGGLADVLGVNKTITLIGTILVVIGLLSWHRWNHLDAE